MKRRVWLSHQTRSSTVLCLCARAPNPLALRWIQHPCRPHRVDSCITQTLFVHISSGSHIKKKKKRETKIPLFVCWPFWKITKRSAICCCVVQMIWATCPSNFYFILTNHDSERLIHPYPLWCPMASRSVQALRHLQTDSFRAQCVQKPSNRHKTHSSSPSRSVSPLRHLVSRLPLSPSN